MTVSQVDERVAVAHSEDIVFAGDGVRLAGQIEYPILSARQKTFPLIFILHHAGCDDRRSYAHYAQAALASGYAVFRWDKRGTGRSGAGGYGSTTQDAVNAYEVALEQPNVDRKRVIILAQAAGTSLLGDSFGLFARIQLPYGVVLVTNALDEQAVLAIESRMLVIMGQNDWRPWQKFGKAVCETHSRAYKQGAHYYVAPYADRMLQDPRTGAFHFGANTALQEWLQTI